MPSVTHILHMRQRRYLEYARRSGARWGGLVALAFSLVIAISGVAFTLAYTALTRDLPSPKILETLISPPSGQLLQPTRIFDRTGEHLLLTLENPAAAGSRYVPLTELPAEVLSATLTAMDPAFYEHPGFSISGLFQSEPNTLAEGLVADLLLDQEASGNRRDIRKRFLAAQITSTFGRDQILEWYLNTANYGRLAYGIDAAARVYFGKPAVTLNLAEAALLASIPASPTINPQDTRQASLDRQQEVLEQMAAAGLISAQKAKDAAASSLIFQAPASYTRQVAPDFVQLALRRLAAQFGWNRLERGGFRILTTLDYNLQEQADCTAAAHLRQLQPGETPNLELEGTPACEGALLLPTQSSPEFSEPIDLSANVVISDPLSGQVLALVVDAPPGTDTAIYPGRPPGTLLTPFVYLTSFTRGQSPGSLVWDIPAEDSGPLAGTPNLDGMYSGPLRLRSALANDDLAPAVQTFFQVGAQNTWRIARQMGLDTLALADEQQSQQTLWGGGQVSLVDMVQAFGTLANNGVMAGEVGPGENGDTQQSLQPTYVLQVQDPAGKMLVYETSPNYKTIVSPQLAYLLTESLSDEAIRWRSLGHPNSLEIGRPAAAKLGQTLDGQDGWAVGYTPQIVVGVWVGSQGENTGAPLPQAAADLWHALIQYASRSFPQTAWTKPPGISEIDVCDPSGLLPTAICPNIVSEIYASGNEPTQVDNLYQAIKINRETGLLATVSTPPELVDERIYLIVPPEAQPWAEQAGLQVPPVDYDLLLPAANVSSDLAINNPEPFAYLRGVVEIRGSAAGPDFDFYRVQAGQGLIPQSWVQIGSDQHRPVRNGLLGTWDTTGLNGLYVIQLVQVGNDQRIATTTVQVTVDNLSPTGQILSPGPGEIIDLPVSRPILLQVEASDELRVEQVTFKLNGQTVGTVLQAPYMIAWDASPGDYQLTALIIDAAGNVSELVSNFVVQR
jgi:membrane peptidoglycan carboxypeptidase